MVHTKRAVRLDDVEATKPISDQGSIPVAKFFEFGKSVMTDGDLKGHWRMVGFR